MMRDANRPTRAPQGPPPLLVLIVTAVALVFIAIDAVVVPARGQGLFDRPAMPAFAAALAVLVSIGVAWALQWALGRAPVDEED